MSSSKSHVAVATNIPNLSSGQQQKDYNSEEYLGRQNSFSLNRRSNIKGKYLTRSHAMRESTSPPRTPTPRASESSSQLSPTGFKQQQQHMDGNNGNNNNSNNKLHTQSSSARGDSPIIDTPTVIVTSQHKQNQQQHQQQQSNVSLCNESEFPKLSPPKSKNGSNNNVGAALGVGSGSISSSSGLNNNCNNSQQRNNNPSEGHNNNNNANKNNNNSNKKTNGDNESVNETHNKTTNNSGICSANANTNYNQSRQKQLSAGNALQKALNVSDNTQSAPIYNSPMNYQLHPNDINRDQQQQPSFIFYDKENRCPRNDSQNSMNSNEEIHYEGHQQQHHQQHQSNLHHQRSGGTKKHRTNSNSKGSKPRLKNMGGTNSGSVGGILSTMSTGSIIAAGSTSSNIDGSLNSSNSTSGFISRVFTNSENCNEQYTDHGGTDLLSFFKETLNKNVKDRQFLLKIEKDLIEFVQEGNRGEIRFPQASSYNRMLIHRTAAFFGMEHNVDNETQQCVIVAPSKNTRIPEIRFKTLVINNRDDSRRSILKRDTHSFDEARQSSYLCPDRGGMLDRKAKSFEEREEDYDRARSRIFNRCQNDPCSVGGDSTNDDFISRTSSVDQQQFSRSRSSGKVSKIQNSSDNRGGVVGQKTNNSFGNYGSTNQGATPLLRGDSGCSNKSSGNGSRIFSKPDSAGSSNTSWRVSSASSGFKAHTQPTRSHSVTPSSTGGYGSDEPHLPDHLSAIAQGEFNEDSMLPFPSGLVWAVTDISNVPKGSIIINPQTLQPILNADG